jgi:hypothetical protein
MNTYYAGFIAGLSKNKFLRVRAKMTHKNRKKLRNLMVGIAGCSF